MENIRRTNNFHIVEFEDGEIIRIHINSTKKIFANVPVNVEMDEIAMFQAILEYQRRVSIYGSDECGKIGTVWVKETLPILLRKYSISDLIKNAYELKYYEWEEILKSPNPCDELDKYN